MKVKTGTPSSGHCQLDTCAFPSSVSICPSLHLWRNIIMWSHLLEVT